MIEIEEIYKAGFRDGFELGKTYQKKIDQILQDLQKDLKNGD